MRLIYLPFAALFFSATCFGQNDPEILAHYLTAIKNVRTVSYDIQRIDTFLSGDVWNHKGKCTLQRATGDTILGFHFLGINLAVKEKNLYDGQQLFIIDDLARNYTALRPPLASVIGAPGGQMAVKEFLLLDKKYKSVQSFKFHDSDIVRIDYDDDTVYNSSDYKKLIFLDASTHLPIRIVSTLMSLGEKQIQEIILSNIKINGHEPNIDDKAYLASYAQKQPEQEEVRHLIGRRAPPFSLTSFSGQLVSLTDYSGKTILLDFWEIWCGPCIASMPRVQSLFDKYQSKGLSVLSIMSEEKSLESAKELVAKKGYNFTDLIGNSSVQNDYNITAVPKYFLIDENGKIIYESYGYNQQLEDALKKKFGF